VLTAPQARSTAEHQFNMRIGVHFGQVIAGVIGTTKLRRVLVCVRVRVRACVRTSQPLPRYSTQCSHGTPRRPQSLPIPSLPLILPPARLSLAPCMRACLSVCLSVCRCARARAACDAMDRRYDIWGPDVMVAHKLEGQGYPGKIHASKAAVQYLQDSYVFEKSGKQVEVAPNVFPVF
jgi:hypothetical protein